MYISAKAFTIVVLCKIGFDRAEIEPSKVWPAEDTGILPENAGMLGY